MHTLALLTSGGDAPGMNTAIAAATKVATAAGWTVIGVERGYDGLIDGRFRPLTPHDVDDIWHRGGTFLGSARSMRFLTKEGRARAAHNLAGVEALVVIGGNGSLTGAHALSVETGIRTVGIPASIDNDLACTSTSIGVDSALNTIVEACDRINDTASSHRRMFIVEVMGRACGYLAMASAIGAAADAVLFREQGKSEDQLVAELRAVLQQGFAPARAKRRILVIKAEGVEIPTERLVTRLREHLEEDAPGADIRYTILGHVVRGGNPSFRDRLVAGRLAFAAVHAAIDGASDQMVGWEAEEQGGADSVDPSIRLFALDHVLTETIALLSGDHPTTRRRIRMLEAVQGALPL